MTFGERIAAERKKRGLSLRDAAAVAGISHTYLAALEAGMNPRTGEHVMPSQRVLYALCRAYGLDVTENVPLLDFLSEDDRLLYMAKQLQALKSSNPAKYREMLNIITGD